MTIGRFKIDSKPLIIDIRGSIEDIMSRNKIRVLIVGEQFLYRMALANLLSCVYDIEIVGVTSFSNGTEWTVDNSPPDVAIVDMDAPDDRGFALVRRIKHHLPSIGIVALKSNPHDVELFVALKSQDAACLDKSFKISQLVAVIKQVASTEAVVTAIRQGIVTLD